MEKELIDRVKRGCVGYIDLGGNLHSFGSERTRALVPHYYLSAIQPISLFRGLENSLHTYSENKRLEENKRQKRKREKFDKENLDNLIIYHVPLNLAQLEEEFERDINTFALIKREARDKDVYQEIMGIRNKKDYTDAVMRIFPEPFFIHQRGYVPPSDQGRGCNTYFLVVGDRGLTSEFSQEIVRAPLLIALAVSELIGVDINDPCVTEPFYSKRKLIFFDPTRNPKKICRPI
ncbi:hypothetical protein HYT23_03560 [Candidatus Pacearchaeota archaeon]|nr:hypothetical protein [Candidatus Pacearchaeota archaeon]